MKSNEAFKIVLGEWKTYTIDISGFGEECTEFSFILAEKNVIYLKDIVIS